ncbi:LptF/LptG family permease [Devosia rhodophyticola]|uniref:LptF/LptG family permease n=1 Tax=Devosia rhodophyticola TaxID=3026423 RepID=A0ABY7YWM8_9HYPH|nr:LptF/LptG family permease [Devosia rhodophyticola]WDR05602.1 LptF/LptG family permease [Devosia rhodophyticola]
MKRLTVYLARLFATDAVILFAVVCFLLWLVGCLRAFDLISVKGQGIATLGWQALLNLPPLAMTFLFICVGIGLARALQALQSSHELHIVHTVNGMGAMFRAVALVAIIGAICALALSNFIAPLAARQSNDLTNAIAADLVSSTLKPGRFTQVTPGVLLLIGGRSGTGQINEFFADDRRKPDIRRTYIARSATIARTTEGYTLELRKGSLQTIDAGRFSEITFDRYDLAIDQLTRATPVDGGLQDQDSLTIIQDAMNSPSWSPKVIDTLTSRFAEGLRVLGICVLVVGISGFPSGRRAGFVIPMEAAVLAMGFAERGVSTYSPTGPTSGAMIMIVLGMTLIFVRTRPRSIPGMAS